MKYCWKLNCFLYFLLPISWKHFFHKVPPFYMLHHILFWFILYIKIHFLNQELNTWPFQNYNYRTSDFVNTLGTVYKIRLRDGAEPCGKNKQTKTHFDNIQPHLKIFSLKQLMKIVIKDNKRSIGLGCIA